MGPPAIFGEYPWTASERRLMAHVLSVTTGQVCHPIPLLILMKPNNCLVHDSLPPFKLTTCRSITTPTDKILLRDTAGMLPGSRITSCSP
jgi:hypothetical protein